MSEHQCAKTSKTTDSAKKQKAHINQHVLQHSHHAVIIQHAHAGLLTHVDVLHLQLTIGNRAVVQLMSDICGRTLAQKIPIQHQKPEEEEEEEEELLQGKTAGECLQCQVLEEEEEKEEDLIQTKPLVDQITPLIQRRVEEEEEEEPLQTKRDMNTTPELQAVSNHRSIRFRIVDSRGLNPSMPILSRGLELILAMCGCIVMRRRLNLHGH